MKLFYLPLESYQERYTWLMSCVGGWAETHFKKNNVDFERIEGEMIGSEITTGVVLDAYGRSYYAMSQIQKVILKIQKGEIKDGDVIYTEDFWQPGIESLFYIRSITGINFKIGCFFHAQSVDDSDFTYSMRSWIRDIEKGMTKGYDYIFVCSPILKELCEEAGFDADKFYVIGLPYNSEKLLEQIEYKEKEKERYVLFSSRFDKEKNPRFFMNLVRECPDIQFKLVKPRKTLSNDPEVEQEAYRLEKEVENFEIVDTSKKQDYYDLLAKAEIQFNCAYQDWVSWTLLEAITFGCKVLYPKWKDFPYELDYDERYLYQAENLSECKEKLYQLLDNEFDKNLLEIVKAHDKSWLNYLKTMKLVD